ncbi:MAG: hypothetical protein ABSG38_17395 [Spirochaetia bacterium]|jgi:hypothetical protein
MGKRALLLAVFLLPAWAASVEAQSNAVVDSLLSEKAATFGEAVYMVMAAITAVPDTASPADAITALQAQKWEVKVQDASSPVTLGQYSYLLMRAFKMRGGLMYSLFPGPRYAARELAFRKLISGDSSPYRTLSGEEVVQILGSVMSYEGAGS